MKFENLFILDSITPCSSEWKMEEISLRKHDNYQDFERKKFNIRCEVEPNNTHTTHTHSASFRDKLNVCMCVSVKRVRVCVNGCVCEAGVCFSGNLRDEI